MFYTKYRPQKFSDLQNLKAVKKTLISQLKQKKVAHAYLFTGPKGTGKTTTARLLAKAVNCKKLKNGEPCLICDNCRGLLAGTFLDLFEIDAASNRGIDDVRALRERIKLSPVSGQYKIYIIDEVHMLTREAFNALLKTLEEPPPHVIFVLCTTELYKVPPTVVSRCQLFNFRKAKNEDLVTRLQKICAEEKVTVEEEVLANVAAAADGGYRDAETILEQILTGEQSVESLLGLHGHLPIINFLESLSIVDVKACLTLLNEYFEEEVDLELFTKGLLILLRELLFIKVGIGEKASDISTDEYLRKEDITRRFSESDLNKLITLCMQAELTIRNTSIPPLPLELMVVRYSLYKETVEENMFSKKKTGGLSGKNKEVKIQASQEEGEGKLNIIKERWGEILKVIRPHNHSIEALLKSCSIESFDGDILTLKTYYKFHQERLECVKNRNFLEGIISDFLKSDIKVRCFLGDKRSEKSIESDLIGDMSTPEIFGGELF